MSRDPRSSSKLSSRDVEALLFIGEGYEVAQYQLHEAVFRRRSEVVVSRFVQRWIARGFLLAQRWNNIGVNRLRLTFLGRDELVSRGFAKESQLFAPRKGVALKDIAHTLWINDLRIVFGQCEPGFDVVLPAWALQRRFSPVPRAIPDVLAVRSPQADDAGRLVAAEVDLGGERLNAIFLPKLVRLQKLVREWAADAPSQIVVFTRGAQRAALLEQFATQIPEVAISVALLPEQNGRGALNVMRKLVAAHVDGVNSGCSDDLTAFSAEEQQIEQLTVDDGVRLLEEEEGTGEFLGYATTTFGFPRTVEECHQRMAELQQEAQEIRLRLLNDDDNKQFLWRRLGMIRDYVAEIQRALAESAE
jgi:hypothetical protein